MHHLIYLSRATAPFDTKQLQQLLTQSRLFNQAHDLTGLLLYSNEQFFQVLEGDKAIVHALYARIQQDPRHRDVTTYADKAIPQRAFTDWSMAFQALPPQQLLEFAGYISPAEVQLERPNLSEADRLLLQLLRSFMLPDGG